PDERHLPGLNDDIPLRAGDVIRLMTTGGGGWGDPLERETDTVLLDVIQGKVSARSAHDDYGVALTGEGDEMAIDEDATRSLRRQIAASREEFAMIDRGPGYESLRTQSQAG
ncbi:MAG TPA: hydantoinase B/oxoprolinase family protein, partial [Chloroflexota bacterium]